MDVSTDAPMAASTSHLTLQNETADTASVIVTGGDAMVARIPGLPPGAVQRVPTTQAFTVVASTIVDGNTYTSAPIVFTGAMRCLAQIVQHEAQGTYAFDVVTMPSGNGGQLEFEKTAIGPVAFQVSLNGRSLQSVVVDNDFTLMTVPIGQIYSIYAVINGITTETTITHDPNAVLAVVEDSDGMFKIVIR